MSKDSLVEGESTFPKEAFLPLIRSSFLNNSSDWDLGRCGIIENRRALSGAASSLMDGRFGRGGRCSGDCLAEEGLKSIDFLLIGTKVAILASGEEFDRLSCLFIGCRNEGTKSAVEYIEVQAWTVKSGRKEENSEALVLVAGATSVEGMESRRRIGRSRGGGITLGDASRVGDGRDRAGTKGRLRGMMEGEEVEEEDDDEEAGASGCFGTSVVTLSVGGAVMLLLVLLEVDILRAAWVVGGNSAGFWAS